MQHSLLTVAHASRVLCGVYLHAEIDSDYQAKLITGSEINYRSESILTLDQ